MTIKKFLAIWEVLQHFKSIFSTALWMLIPGVNLFRVIAYANDNLYELPRDYYRKLEANFWAALDPFTATKQYWAKWGSESVLSIGYAIAAIAMNLFWVNQYFNMFPEYTLGAKPEWFLWAGYAVAVIALAYVVHAIFNMLHSIYKSHTLLHPEYAKFPLEKRYLESRAKAIAERDAIVKVPTAV